MKTEMHMVEILLVEDNPGDVDLARETLLGCKIKNGLHVVNDGEKAMQFLRRESPLTMPSPGRTLFCLT